MSWIPDKLRQLLVNSGEIDLEAYTLNVQSLVQLILNKETSASVLLALLNPLIPGNEYVLFEDELGTFDVELSDGLFTLSIAVDEDVLTEELDGLDTANGSDEGSGSESAETDQSEEDLVAEIQDGEPAPEILNSMQPDAFNVVLLNPPDYTLKELRQDLHAIAAEQKRGPIPNPVNPLAIRWVYHIEATASQYYGVIFADSEPTESGDEELMEVTIIRFASAPTDLAAIKSQPPAK